MDWMLVWEIAAGVAIGKVVFEASSLLGGALLYGVLQAIDGERRENIADEVRRGPVE